jgi:hypothetical protein
MNMSVESSISNVDEWDAADFDEANSLKKDPKNPKPFAFIESRFLMHDLIKITSRKSSTKIITFYFRIPFFEEYQSQLLEHDVVAQLDLKPPQKYIFAFKRS